MDPPVGRGGSADCLYGFAMDHGPAMGSLSRGQCVVGGSGLWVKRRASRALAIGYRRYGPSRPAHRGHDRRFHHRKPGRDVGHLFFLIDVVGELDPGRGLGSRAGALGIRLVVVEPSGQRVGAGSSCRSAGWPDMAGVPPDSHASSDDLSGRQPVSAGAGTR